MRYDILERTGEGTLFQVLTTRDKLLGRVGAVKTLCTEFDADMKVTYVRLANVYNATPHAADAHRETAAHYAAPELATTDILSPATDVYALGATLYEMLCGATPFPAETTDAVTSKQLNDPVPSPKTLNPAVPHALEGVVMKALRK